MNDLPLPANASAYTKAIHRFLAQLHKVHENETLDELQRETLHALILAHIVELAMTCSRLDAGKPDPFAESTQ